MAMPPIALADHIWQSLAASINRGVGFAIRVPDEYKPQLGQEGMKAIVAHYSHLLGVPAIFTSDLETGIIGIEPPQTTWDPVVGQEASEENDLGGKRAKLPRPPNAFILYRQHHHPIVKEAHPGLHNNQISIVLGKQWRNEESAIKDLYKRQADNLKKKHMEEHPHYQYQPRKPSEKKRRMTRRKASAVSNRVDPLEGASTQVVSMPMETSLPMETPLPTDLSPVFPVFDKTPAGNPVVTFGTDEFDDETFRKLLNEFNESVTTARPRAEVNNQFIFTERTEEAREDFTFYQDDMDALFEGVVEMDGELQLETAMFKEIINEKDDDWHVTDETWEYRPKVVPEVDPRHELEHFTRLLSEFK